MRDRRDVNHLVIKGRHACVRALALGIMMANDEVVAVAKLMNGAR